MHGTWKLASILLAGSLLTLGCGSDAVDEPTVVDTARAPGAGQPSLAEWVPEGRAGAAPAHEQAGHGGMPAGHGGAARPLGANPHGPGGSIPLDDYATGNQPPQGAVAPPTAAAPAAGDGVVSGTVRETMDAAGYTYMRVETSTGGMRWVAGAQTTVAVGDQVRASGSVMRGFRSNTLDRTFDELVLASTVQVGPPPAPN